MMYTIKNMRVVKPSAKIAEKHPDRFCTVYGEFFDAEGRKMSIVSKVITFDDARDPETKIDLKKGILSLKENARGRKKSESITQDAIEAELKSLRGE